MLITALVASTHNFEKHPYEYVARFVEACSCKDVCVTEITGRDAGCHGLGAIAFDSGSYDGKDLSGTAAAFAWDSGKWVWLDVDAPASKRAGVTALMKAFLADWGTLGDIQYQAVRVSQAKGTYGFWVDGGRKVTLTVKPVLGADGKTPVMHSNLSSPIHSVLMQGECVQGGLFGPNSFSLQGTNGFYNMKTKMKGQL